MVLIILNCSFSLNPPGHRPYGHEMRTHPQQPNILARVGRSPRARQRRFTSLELSGFWEVTYSPLHVLTSYSCLPTLTHPHPPGAKFAVLRSFLVHSVPKTPPHCVQDSEQLCLRGAQRSGILSLNWDRSQGCQRCNPCLRLHSKMLCLHNIFLFCILKQRQIPPGHGLTLPQHQETFLLPLPRCRATSF